MPYIGVAFRFYNSATTKLKANYRSDPLLFRASGFCIDLCSSHCTMATKEPDILPDMLTEKEIPESRGKLTCSICLDAYKEPKVLPCCHTFCRTCLEGLVAKTDSAEEKRGYGSAEHGVLESAPCSAESKAEEVRPPEDTGDLPSIYSEPEQYENGESAVAIAKSPTYEVPQQVPQDPYESVQEEIEDGQIYVESYPVAEEQPTEPMVVFEQYEASEGDFADFAKEKLRCPECRTEHDVPEQGVGGFLTDFSLVGDVKEPVCEECEGGERAVAYCHDCEAFVCEGCKLALHRAKRYRNHFIQSLSENSNEPLESYKQISSSLACTCHPPEKQQAYCQTCQCLVCVYCIVEKHQQHILGRIDDRTRREVDRKLTKQKEQAEVQLTSFEQHMRHVESVEQLVSGRPEKVKQAINTAIDANIALLESRRKTLLEKVESKHEADMKNIWSQKEHVAMATLGLKSALRFSERVLQCSSNPELLSLAPQACSRLEELNSLTWEPDKLHHIKKTNVHFTCKELSHSLKYFGSLEEKIKSAFFIEGLPPTVGIGESVELKIVEKDMQHSEIWSTKSSLDVSVKHHYGNQKTLHPQLSPHGQWMVTFTPNFIGRNTILVKSHGITLAQSETAITMPLVEDIPCQPIDTTKLPSAPSVDEGHPSTDEVLFSTQPAPPVFSSVCMPPTSTPKVQYGVPAATKSPRETLETRHTYGAHSIQRDSWKQHLYTKPQSIPALRGAQSRKKRVY